MYTFAINSRIEYVIGCCVSAKTENWEPKNAWDCSSRRDYKTNDENNSYNSTKSIHFFATSLFCTKKKRRQPEGETLKCASAERRD